MKRLMILLAVLMIASVSYGENGPSPLITPSSVSGLGTIATGTARIGRLVSQGESFIWNGLAGTFTGVIQTDNASTVIRIDGAWGQYEK